MRLTLSLAALVVAASCPLPLMAGRIPIARVDAPFEFALDVNGTEHTLATDGWYDATFSDAADPASVGLYQGSSHPDFPASGPQYDWWTAGGRADLPLQVGGHDVLLRLYGPREGLSQPLGYGMPVGDPLHQGRLYARLYVDGQDQGRYLAPIINFTDVTAAAIGPLDAKSWLLSDVHGPLRTGDQVLFDRTVGGQPLVVTLHAFGFAPVASAVARVPEPATWVLALIAAVAMLHRERLGCCDS